MTNDRDDVGVVAIGRNEGERLIACLASIKSETNNVLYVDSGSSDGSAAAAERLGAIVINLDSIRPFTAARAYNEGFKALKALKSDICFVEFIDGDCTLAKGWLDTAIAFMNQRKDVAVVSGRLRERHPTASVYNRLCDIEWDTPIGEALECGANALWRVEAFEAVGGFKPQLIAGEEPELCLRLRERKWKIWRLDAEVGLHDAAMTRFSQWWVRSVRYGYSMADVSQLYRRNMQSAIFWSSLLPIAICLSALIHPGVLLGGALAYFLQLCRIALARGPGSSHSWTWAAFVMVGKLPQIQGMLKFLWLSLRRRQATLIEYK